MLLKVGGVLTSLISVAVYMLGFSFVLGYALGAGSVIAFEIVLFFKYVNYKPTDQDNQESATSDTQAETQPTKMKPAAKDKHAEKMEDDFR